MRPEKLYRTTIVIWSEIPSDDYELDELASAAIEGDCFCSSIQCEEVTDPKQFPQTEFFDTPED